MGYLPEIKTGKRLGILRLIHEYRELLLPILFPGVRFESTTRSISSPSCRGLANTRHNGKEVDVFNDEFLEKLPEDPVAAAHVMCEAFLTKYADIPRENESSIYEDFAEGYAAIESFIEAVSLPFQPPKLQGDKGQRIGDMYLFVRGTFDALDNRLADVTLSRAREKFRTRFGIAFLYEFSDGDLKRIQELVNELRDIVVKSELYDAKHKDRILSKLEALQRELYKKMSNFDKLWGLIGEAGVAIGRFGVDAKPFVDRIREIAQITWRTQARAEELPSGASFPLLAAPETKED